MSDGHRGLRARAVVVAVVVAVVAPSAVSLIDAFVTRVPVPTDTSTVALMVPSEVPTAIGVAAVEVHVNTVLPAERTQLYPVGVGAEAKVSPAGSVMVATGSL